MKLLKKLVPGISIILITIFLATACATQPEEVVEEVPAEEVVEPTPVVEEGPAETAAVAEEVVEEEAPVVEEEVAEVAEEAAVAEEAVEDKPVVDEAVVEEEAAAVAAEAVVEPVVETFRLIGTNGLLSLAVATYEGGFGLDDVSAVVEYAKAGAPTLVLDAGTNAVSIPDLPLGMEDGAALAAVVDAIGYAAMTPGVADFSFGTAGLQMLDEAADMAVVSANAAGLAPSTMIEYKGIKVGIFGLTSPKANAKGANVSPVMADIMAAAEKAVMDLKADGADVVIALTNMGYEQAGFTAGELDWAAEYMDGYVDLIIDGMGSIPYSEIRGNTMYVQLGGQVGALEITVTDGVITGVETLLIDEAMIAGLKPSAEVAAILNAEGARLAAITKVKAPVFEAAEVVEEAPVVEEEVVVEEEAVAAVAAEVVEEPAVEETAPVVKEETAIGETVAVEEEAEAVVEEQMSPEEAEEAFMMQEIANLPFALDGERAHILKRPTNLGKTITQAMIAATGADAALISSGGIRASMDAGIVTVNEVVTVLPFGYKTVVIEVTGEELLAALENGIKDLPNPSGAYPQFSGIEAIWNRFNEPGERLFKVKVNGVLVDPAATYRLATNDFIAGGGDGYTVFADNPVLAEAGLLAENFGYYLNDTYPIE